MDFTRATGHWMKRFTRRVFRWTNGFAKSLICWARLLRWANDKIKAKCSLGECVRLADRVVAIFLT